MFEANENNYWYLNPEIKLRWNMIAYIFKIVNIAHVFQVRGKLSHLIALETNEIGHSIFINAFINQLLKKSELLKQILVTFHYNWFKT